MNYLISSLLLILTCLSGFADQGNKSNVKAANSSPKNSSSAKASKDEPSFAKASKDEPSSAEASKGKPPTSAPEDELVNAPVEKVNDPFERINRTTFRFNDSVTTHVLQPLARGYEHILPRPVRTGISNVFDNADFPVRFGNNVLQGRFTRSAQEVGKFVINSTVGIGGLFRVSDHVQSLADVPAEDFGLTLGRWGFSTGPYVVLLVLGPSNFRDLTGFAGDYALNPLNWYQIGIISHKFIPNAANYAIAGSKFVARLPGNVHTYEQMKEAAVDPYIAVRNAYLNHRAEQLRK